MPLGKSNHLFANLLAAVTLLASHTHHVCHLRSAGSCRYKGTPSAPHAMELEQSLDADTSAR